MRPLRKLWMASVWTFLVGCGGDGAPAGPVTPTLDFMIEAPREIDTKSSIEIVVTVTAARGVQYPLSVRLEKANLGEPFFGQGAFSLFPGQSVVTFRAVPGRDPQFRITVTESSPRALTLSKTFAVEVLDFP